MGSLVFSVISRCALVCVRGHVRCLCACYDVCVVVVCVYKHIWGSAWLLVWCLGCVGVHSVGDGDLSFFFVVVVVFFLFCFFCY